jgi:hypothetical protein
MPRMLRTVARTAAVAGTATVVSNRVSRRQQGRWAAQDAQQAQAYEPAPEPVQPMAATDVPTQLKQLADLRDQGVLTDAEFEAQKKKLLAG